MANDKTPYALHVDWPGKQWLSVTQHEKSVIQRVNEAIFPSNGYAALGLRGVPAQD